MKPGKSSKKKTEMRRTPGDIKTDQHVVKQNLKQNFELCKSSQSINLPARHGSFPDRSPRSGNKYNP